MTLNLLGRPRVDLLRLASLASGTEIDGCARVSSPGLNSSPMDNVIKHYILFTLFTSRFPASSMPRTKFNQKFSDPPPQRRPPDQSTKEILNSILMHQARTWTLYLFSWPPELSGAGRVPPVRKKGSVSGVLLIDPRNFGGK